MEGTNAATNGSVGDPEGAEPGEAARLRKELASKDDLVAELLGELRAKEEHIAELQKDRDLAEEHISGLERDLDAAEEKAARRRRERAERNAWRSAK